MKKKSLTDVEVIGFAEMVIKVLDLQQHYFRRIVHRDPDALARCRDAERELRTTAKNVIQLISLAPCEIQGTLFHTAQLPD